MIANHPSLYCCDQMARLILPMMLRFLFLPFVSPHSTGKKLCSLPTAQGSAIHNPSSTLTVLTQTAYSFDTDSHTGGLFLLPISRSKSKTSSPSLKVIVNSPDASGPVRLDNSPMTKKRGNQLYVPWTLKRGRRIKCTHSMVQLVT